MSAIGFPLYDCRSTMVFVDSLKLPVRLSLIKISISTTHSYTMLVACESSHPPWISEAGGQGGTASQKLLAVGFFAVSKSKI